MDPNQTYDLLRNLTTPVVAITARRNGRANGMISDGAIRASIVPEIPRVVVQIHKWHLTHEMVLETGRFVVHLLRRDQVDLVVALGFASGRDRDKMAAIPWHAGAAGAPILDDCYAWFDCTVLNRMDGGMATFFLGNVVEVGRGSGDEPLEPAHLRDTLPPQVRDRYLPNLEEARALARPLAWQIGGSPG